MNPIIRDELKTSKSVEKENRIDLSVIIASVNGLPIIDECLERLVNQSVTSYKVEIVVADRCGVTVTELIKKKYPEVKLVQASSENSIPHLRAMAIERASGPVIGVIEDHCLVETDWSQRMIEAHQGRYAVIGGAVENAACNKLSDWAFFFCEYSQAMNPLPAGEVEGVVGNNVTYKKEVLEHVSDLIKKGVWDSVLHEEIRKAGIAFYSIPSIIVNHKMSASIWWFFSQKFHFARAYSGNRFLNPKLYQRILYGVGSFLLPAILGKRIVSNVWKKKRHRAKLLQASPLLFILLIAWAAGECIGYIIGSGSSPEKVC